MHGLSAWIRWTGSFNTIVAFLDRQKKEKAGEGVLQPCARTREAGRERCLCPSLPHGVSVGGVPSPKSLSFPKASHITGPYTCGMFQWEEQWDWANLRCMGFVSGLEMVYISEDTSLRLCEKRMDIFSVEAKQDKRLSVLYLYSCTPLLSLAALRRCTKEGEHLGCLRSSFGRVLWKFVRVVSVIPAGTASHQPKNHQQNTWISASGSVWWEEQGRRSQAVGSGRCRWLWLWQGYFPRQSCLISMWCLEVDIP